jgi:hypothetical protein
VIMDREDRNNLFGIFLGFLIVSFVVALVVFFN